MIGVELLLVRVEEPDLFARLLWAAQRDPVAALAAVHLLDQDGRVQVVTDAVVRTEEGRPARLSSETRTPAGGSFQLLVTELTADGPLLDVHLTVQDPDIDWQDSPGLGMVRRIDQDFTVRVDGDLLPLVPAPQVLALVWPTEVGSDQELRDAVVARSMAADRVAGRYDTDTLRQRRAAVDDLLVW